MFYTKHYLVLIISLVLHSGVFGQAISTPSKSGWFSLGGRNTLSTFTHDGTGLGTGGQFRIQLSQDVNTEWFADYIMIGMPDGVRSTYYHIGWSVLFYPYGELRYPRLIQPYILAGHCFDYNEKTVINTPSISASRWGSAVQAGIGTHVNLSEKFDLSVCSQYMVHLTNELNVEKDAMGNISIQKDQHNSAEGHLLITISINYKIFRLWEKL
jgi:hypothetical protein